VRTYDDERADLKAGMRGCSVPLYRFLLPAKPTDPGRICEGQYTIRAWGFGASPALRMCGQIEMPSIPPVGLNVRHDWPMPGPEG
jgi:hypothetical protein